MLAAVWQGALLGAGLVVAVAIVLGFAWWATWGWRPQWEEARRHTWRPRIAVERWTRCRWIHRDCEYWLLHLHLGRGPVRLEGRVPEGVYWSLTWYSWTDAHPSISSANATPSGGRYAITLSADRVDGDWLEVPREVRRVLVYLRVYEPVGRVPLPRVLQGDRVLVAERG